jgi:hypothetical protein
MTLKVRRALMTIHRTVKKNRPRVARAFSQSGVRARHALVFSAAKYYTTLKKLAKE